MILESIAADSKTILRICIKAEEFLKYLKLIQKE